MLRKKCHIELNVLCPCKKMIFIHKCNLISITLVQIQAKSANNKDAFFTFVMMFEICYVPGVTRNKFRKPKFAIWKVSKKHF